MKKKFDTFNEIDGDKWFRRNKSRVESEKSNLQIRILTKWLQPFEKEINKILEIGYGSGHQLNYISKNLNSKAYGIDISSEAINYIKKKFPKIDAKKSNGNKIPFSNKFDLVHLGFILAYYSNISLDKKLKYFYSLVKKGKFFSVMEFDVPHNYSNIYKHNENVLVYKRNITKLILSLGNCTLVNKIQFSHKDQYFSKNIDERVSLALFYKEK